MDRGYRETVREMPEGLSQQPANQSWEEAMRRDCFHSNLVLFFPLRPQLPPKQRPTIATSMCFVVFFTSFEYSVNFLFKPHRQALSVQCGAWLGEGQEEPPPPPLPSTFWEGRRGGEFRADLPYLCSNTAERPCIWPSVYILHFYKNHIHFGFYPPGANPFSQSSIIFHTRRPLHFSLSSICFVPRIF